MNRYRLLEHTADMGVEAQGETRAELFRQMALGVRRIITACPLSGVQRTMSVTVTGGDREELLVNWLGELVYLLENQGFLLADVEITAIDDYSLQALLSGAQYDPSRHFLEREIKAVTYHQLEVREEAAGWSARVFVDL